MTAAVPGAMAATRVPLPRSRRPGAKPLLSLSLDLDNLWSYQKTRGDAAWTTFPTYLDTVTDIVLDMLARLGMRLTVFVVGQDAAIEGNHAALRRLADAGLEIGNHSFNHEPWLHLYSLTQLEEELGRAHEAIAEATGQHPTGFRGPGFSLSDDTLRVLCRQGYTYDCSTFPTFLGPLARMYYFRQSRDFSQSDKEKRAQLFGTFSDGLRPLRPYRWQIDGKTIVEIPVTTLPIARVPIHMSYLLYLAGFSPALSRAYLRTAVAMCRAGGVEPSFLLHPLDFISADEAPSLKFFPGMQLTARFKQQQVSETLAYLSRYFSIVTMKDHAEAAAG